MDAFTADWHDAYGLLGLENRVRQLLEMIENMRLQVNAGFRKYIHEKIQVMIDGFISEVIEEATVLSIR